MVADDGNFDVCAVVQRGWQSDLLRGMPTGLPRRLPRPDAPPEDEDDDAAWFCPPCALQLGMRQGAA